jgi:hypothetical protein
MFKQGFSEVEPEVFLRRVAKGPPDEHRWAAWKTVMELDRHIDHSLFQ